MPQVLTLADCAVNVNPTAEQLATIACSSADTAAAFGLEPRCAMLSYSTLGSGAGPDVDLVSPDSSCNALSLLLLQSEYVTRLAS